MPVARKLWFVKFPLMLASLITVFTPMGQNPYVLGRTSKKLRTMIKTMEVVSCKIKYSQVEQLMPIVLNTTSLALLHDIWGCVWQQLEPLYFQRVFWTSQLAILVVVLTRNGTWLYWLATGCGCTNLQGQQLRICFPVIWCLTVDHQSFLGSVVVDIFTSCTPVRQSKWYTSSFPDPFLMKFWYTDPIPSRKLKRGSNWGGSRDLSDSSFRHAAQYLEHCIIKPSLNSPQNFLFPES